MTRSWRDLAACLYRREFLEVFMQPSERWGLLNVIVGVLAGDIFATRNNRFKLALFFALVKLQKWRGVIAPLNPISGAFDARTSGVTLPRRFVGSELQASGDAVWVTGTLTDSQKALLRLDTRDHGVVEHSRLVMFRVPNGSTMLGTAGNDVLVAADGELYRVDIR